MGIVFKFDLVYKEYWNELIVTFSQGVFSTDFVRMALGLLVLNHFLCFVFDNDVSSVGRSQGEGVPSSLE